MKIPFQLHKRTAAVVHGQACTLRQPNFVNVLCVVVGWLPFYKEANINSRIIIQLPLDFFCELCWYGWI